MKKEQQLKELERKTYLAYHKDGLIDVIIGLSVLGFGLNMALESSAFSIFSWIWFIMYMPLKKRITFPRFGYVEWKPNQQVWRRWAITIGIVVLVFLIGAVFLLGAGSANMPPIIKSLLKQYHMLFLGIIGAILAVTFGLLTGIRRLFTYAGLTLLIILGGTWLEIEPAFYVMTIGGLILLWGIWLLWRFLRGYPLPAEEDFQPIADIDRTIHAPARLQILALLMVIESADFTFLMRQTGLTRGNLSSHLGKLEEAGYIRITKEFVDKIPRTLIRLTDEGREAIQDYRETMRQVVEDLLAAS
jgi:DNA-binding MarR family transcriptional regulator